MVRVSEINLNEKDIFFPYHHWNTYFSLWFYFIILSLLFHMMRKFSLRVPRVWSTFKKTWLRLQRKCIQFLTGMLICIYFITQNLDRKLSFPLEPFGKYIFFHPKRDSSPWEQETTPILDFYQEKSDENTIKLFKRLFELSIFSLWSIHF